MIRSRILVFGLAFAIAGCQAGSAPVSSNPPSSGGGSDKLAPYDVHLVVGDGKGLNLLIASHKGNVVFVDMWATWCGPCVAGFPETVATARKYRERGLATIGVNFDQLADHVKVREFLAKQGADFENLMSQYDGVSQQAAVDFDVEALPQYRLYDRQGKLRKQWEGKSDAIEAEIEALLAEPATTQ